MQFCQKYICLKKLERQNEDDMSRDLSSSSIPLLCVRFHRKRINTSPRKHFQLITIATSFCFRPTRAKYYFWWPTIKSYDCVRPEILVSIAFCQLHIFVFGVIRVLIMPGPVIAAQVTIREMNTPTRTARTRPLSRVSSLNNLILLLLLLPSHIKYRAAQTCWQ